MVTDQTRRQFLQSATALGVGGWLSTLAAAVPAGAADTKLRVGVLGFGQHGRAYARSVADRECVAAVCESDASRLAAAGLEHPSAVRFSDCRQMLQAERLDAVVVSMADGVSVESLTAVLSSGLHVFCDAFPRTSLLKQRQVLETARRSGAVAHIAHNSGARDRLQQASAALRNGAIGPIREVICWSGGEHAADRPAKWSAGVASLSDRGWQTLLAAYEGLSLSHPTFVAAASTDATSDTAAATVIRYEFPVSAQGGPVRMTWYDGGWAPPYESIDGIRLPANGSLFLGADGQLLLSAAGEITLLRDDLPGPKVISAIEEGSVAGVPDWLAGCRRTPHASIRFERGCALRETVLAGILACRMQQPLEWDGPGLRARNCPQAESWIRSESLLCESA